MTPVTPRSVRTYVVDTSVLLSDPAAFHRFAEHEVVLPLVVISELEAKRHHPELGWFARQALRLLDDLRVRHGRLDVPVPANDRAARCGWSSTTPTPTVLPAKFRDDGNDARILAVALGIAAEGREVTLVTKDMPLRVKAAAVGLHAEEYRHDQATDPDLDRHGGAGGEPTSRSTELYAGETLDLDAAAGLPCHTGLVLHSPRGSALGRVHAGQGGAAGPRATGRRSGCAAARPSSGSPSTCCWTSRSASSRWAAGPAPASRRSRCAPGWSR